jgi:hypothetical protein
MIWISTGSINEHLENLVAASINLFMLKTNCHEQQQQNWQTQLEKF